jgi:hypothetical protein
LNKFLTKEDMESRINGKVVSSFSFNKFNFENEMANSVTQNKQEMTKKQFKSIEELQQN